MLVVLDRSKIWGGVYEIFRSNFEFAGTLIRSSLKVETERNQEHLNFKREALYVEDLATSPPGTMTCVTECSNTSKEGLLVILYEAIVSGPRIWIGWSLDPPIQI